MNINDVSDKSWVIERIGYWQRHLDEAALHQGMSIVHYPPAGRLISSLTEGIQECNGRDSALRSNNPTLDLQWGDYSILMYPYLPCVLPVADLEPIFINDMKLETHHRGRKTLLRVLAPPERMTGIIIIIVEDEQGTAFTLQACHQPGNVPPEEFMQPGDVFLLKDPYLIKDTTYDLPGVESNRLRVDHLCDIVKLARGDEMIPEKWRRRHQVPSTSLRAQGNEAAEKKEWAKAHRLYTSAIEAAEENTEDRRLAHLNRSLVNLQLGRPEHARKDAKHGNNISPSPAKGLFREALALHELGDFSKSLQRLVKLSRSFPENPATECLGERVMARLREQGEGVYDFRDMYRQAEQTPPLVDCATYSAPVEVRASPGRGNGLFTKVAVSAGQLLLCEKAFGYSYATLEKPETTSVLLNIATKKAYRGGQAGLLAALIHKLQYGSRQMRESFGELHRGDFAASAVVEADGAPIVDSFLVANIMTLNYNGAPRSSYVPPPLARDYSEERRLYNYSRSCSTCGLWLLASRINHSCIANCHRSFIGDMQIIQAARDLDAGSELLVEYRPVQLGETYQGTQAQLSRWGFTCSCEHCLNMEKTCNRILIHRTMVGQKLMDDVLDDLSKAKRMAMWMEKTYPPGAPALDLGWLCLFLAGRFDKEEQWADSIEIVAMGLRAFGFEIETVTPGKRRKPSLTIKRWGHPDYWVPQAFFHLFFAYEAFAPEVCAAVTQYAGLAHSIKYGERETLRDYPWFHFPDEE
ncbi:TPR domain protein [Plectosphaerella plurivora]|uniref:TPR domain protein n=1 Tax=Plectosphaerella plurivora TaxID=936078 RepID=A0A9P8V831_9PEZI|nr:TPR domain protein [Plectosphaerella plurivora]